MNLAIVIDPSDGYGDLMFGYKLALHEVKKGGFENIYLVSYDHRKAQSFFKEAGIPDGVIYLSKDAFDDALAGAAIAVDVLILGPEQYHHDDLKGYEDTDGTWRDVFGHTFMRHLGKETPILLLEEYSYSVENLQKCKVGYEADGFTSVRLLRTGLEAVTEDDDDIMPDAGIFLDTPKATVRHTAFLTLLAGRSRAEFKRDCVFSIAYAHNASFLDLFFRVHQKFAAECCKGKEPKILVVGEELNTEQLAKAKALAGADIVSVKFMPPKALESCYALANGLGGCTGDQSLSDSLSAGLVPVYDARMHKRDVAQSLDIVLAGDNFSFMDIFFGSGSKDTYDTRRATLESYADDEDEEDFATAFNSAQDKVQMIKVDPRYNLYNSVDAVLEEFRCALEKGPALAWYEANKKSNRFADFALLDVGLTPKDLD